MSITKEVIMRIKAQVDASGKVSWENVRKELEGVDKAGEKANSTFASMKTQLLSLAAGYIGVRAALGVLKTGMRELIEDDAAVTRLNSSLARFGITSETAQRSYQEFAESLARTTKFTDNEITSTMALLSTMGLVGDKLREATRISLDLASAFDKDLRGAAMTVGKTLAGETTSGLARYGVVIDDTLPKQEKLAEAMRFFETLSGRSGEDLKTMSGDMATLSKEWQNFTKEITSALFIPDYFRSLAGGLRDIRESLAIKAARQAELEDSRGRLAWLRRGLGENQTPEESRRAHIWAIEQQRKEEARAQEEAAERKRNDESDARDRAARAEERWKEDGKREKEAIDQARRKRKEEQDAILKLAELERKKHADKMRDMAKELDAALKGYGMMDKSERASVRALMDSLKGPNAQENWERMGSEGRAILGRSGLATREMAGFAAQTMQREMSGFTREKLQPIMNFYLNFDSSEITEAFEENVLPIIRRLYGDAGAGIVKDIRGMYASQSAYAEMGGT